jgi:hypothetical protein
MAMINGAIARRPQPLPEPPPPPPALPADGSVADELEKLARRRDTGVLSEGEFTAQKRRLLGS